MLNDAEEHRLRALVHEFGMGGAEELILARAVALVMLALPTVEERERRTALEDLPLGASRFGGPPDVPAGFVWPHLAQGNPMHFHSQLDLSGLPVSPEWPLPTAGMLYTFVGMPGGDHSVETRVLYADTAKKALRRTPRPSSAAQDQLSSEYFAAEFEAFPLIGALGVDFAHRKPGEADLLDQLEERLQPDDPFELLDRFARFEERAADVQFQHRQGSGYPLFWWQVARLFGATNPAHAEDSAARYLEARGERSDSAAVARERVRWRRLLSLHSNTLIGFETLNDARPYQVLVREPAVPWQAFQHVATHVENG